MSSSDAILAYRATSAVEAHALAAHLASAGIDAHVLGEALQGAYAGVSLGGMNLPEVWVAGKDRAGAEPVIAAWRTEHYPAGAIVKPRRFQFSLALMLLGITYVAVTAGSMTMNDAARSIFMPLVSLFLFGGFAIVAWKRYRNRRCENDEG